MQHLDEGTIHAWLDGALTPEEAARVEAHVQECAQCQAAVSEARGFIAASSRILTALDNAPRGVIPAAAAPRRSTQPWIWRIAATVLVVATGTVLLVKERGTDRASMASKSADSSEFSAESRVAAPSATVSPTAAPSASTPSPSTPPVSTSRAKVPAVTDVPVPETAKQNTSAPSVGAGAVQRRAAVGGRANVADERADAVQALSAPSVAPAAAPSPLSGRAFGSSNADIERTTPREVGSRRLVGKTETFYEIAPGDTVVLEEQSLPTSLESAVVTAAGVTRNQSQPAAARKTTAAAESQQKAAAAPPPSPPVGAMQEAAVAGRHSISWLDPSTRRVVVLSGQHSQEELQRIRDQIQRLRDGARPKPNPD
jgi:hypothetical protein